MIRHFAVTAHRRWRLRATRTRLLALALLCGVVLCLPGPADASERQLLTITANSGRPAELVPLVQTQLGAGSTVKSFGNELVLHATPEEVARVRELLQQIDRPPRALMVSVATVSSGELRRLQATVSGRVREGDVEIAAGTDPPADEGVQVQLSDNTLNTEADIQQRVRAIENSPAFIALGQRVPLTTRHYRSDGQVWQSTELTDVERGFWLTARVVDGRVMLDIDQRDDRLAGGVIHTRQLRTSASGGLGEWIPLGEIDRSDAASRRGMGASGERRSSEQHRIAIKVQLIDD